ncbi:glutamate--tRNA ligase [Magnetovibrio blakemorei]|uniref:Glutamate--tRNA ligase n=1 Tax=Magnetovibrio blakemorei TaxID=28181 RepID=A0A1E5Q8C6_9PROT|nr:glutamate--tRNA ligase [Magnetovibrio blakemorei]OEJ67610.1 glutamate--tRNA ligase [Magnetovibrio blakemorei]
MTTFRFAPSPTGYLHVGNARLALINWLAAKHTGGRLILRLDDTDEERSKPEFADAIREDLTWLGVSWDAEEKQSDRLAAYEAAFAQLQSEGRVYPCYETPEELDFMRKRLRSRGLPPIYTPPTAEKLQKYIAEDRPVHWRFKLMPGVIEFDDLVRGPVHFEADKLSDPVVRRHDGSWLYMLPSAVDDRDMGMSHIIRGEDHVANTALQVQMFEAMNAPVPAFAHLPLMTDIEGGGLSKRLGSLALRDLRDDGVEALALASYLAHLGTSDDIKAEDSLEKLVGLFDFNHFSRASPKFDPAQLSRVNAQVLHGTAYGDVMDRLPLGVDEPLWNAVRANLERVADVHIWQKIATAEIDPVVGDEDADFLKQAADFLPQEPWDETTWGTWTAAIKTATGRKGKDLFMPLRQALTGLDHGPELKVFLPLIGFARAEARLKGQRG